MKIEINNVSSEYMPWAVIVNILQNNRFLRYKIYFLVGFDLFIGIFYKLFHRIN